MDNEKIKKIINLAMHGEEGERKNAQYILKNIGIKPEDYFKILSSTPSENNENLKVTVSYKDKDESTIIKQLYFRITNISTISYLQINPRKIEIPFKNSSQAKKFKTNVKTILPLYRKEKKRFLHAFIQANNLYGFDETDTNENQNTIDEIMEIINMAKNIKTAVFDNLLED